MASITHSNGENISLNIMPMLDIFSILILFLLMNFSTDPISYDLNKSVELPESNTLKSLDEVPSLQINKDSILINGNKIITLVDKKVANKDLSQGAIYPLFLELEKMSEASQKFSPLKTGLDTLTVEVDKNHPFELIRQVMLSAQQANFIKFKLMVSKVRS